MVYFVLSVTLHKRGHVRVFRVAAFALLLPLAAEAQYPNWAVDISDGFDMGASLAMNFQGGGAVNEAFFPTFSFSSGWSLGQVRWAIYTNLSDSLPGSTLGHGSATPTLAFQSNIESIWQLTFPTVTLQNGTYWFGMQSASSPVTFYWASSAYDAGTPPGAYFDGRQWSDLPEIDSPGNQLDLSLDDGAVTSTPEPSSITLLGTGLVGLVPVVQCRRKRA